MDFSWPVLVLLAVGAVGWPAFTTRVSPTRPTHPDSTTEERVNRIAQAIAVAEGYYAEGDHDGHSLPYRLNNPGALKKPALYASTLSTWKDTGLVEFPTSDMGWDALRHQVRLMLSGESRIYERADSLLHVGGKYADGDLNWGLNVAAGLGVSPCATLADLAGPHTNQTASRFAPRIAATAAALLLGTPARP